MSSVIALGYLGLEVTDLSAWDKLLLDLYGLERRSDSEEGASHYRIDACHHRIALYQSEQNAIRYIGWEAKTRDDLDAIAARLEGARVQFERASKDQIKERQVLDLIAFEDPDGVKLEVFISAKVDNAPFTPSRPTAGFKIGEMGMGHVVIHCKDSSASIRWYQKMLGFKVSDYAAFPDMKPDSEVEAAFLRCNPRHHSLALVNEAFGGVSGQMAHFMLEAEQLEDVGRAYDLVQEKGHPIAMNMGMHVGDHVLSFYVWTPSGAMIEYGYGGLPFGDASEPPKLYDTTSHWGHKIQLPPNA